MWTRGSLRPRGAVLGPWHPPMVVLFLLTSSNTAPGNLLVFNKHGSGWDVNVHGTLMMLRCQQGLGWGGVGC